jgi:hypothetical protein
MSVRNSRRAPNEQEDQAGNLGELVWGIAADVGSASGVTAYPNETRTFKAALANTPSRNVVLIHINAVAADADSSAT